MREGTFVINHPVGLHARPAAKFTKLAKSFKASIKIKNLTRNSDIIDAKSLVKLIKIAVAKDHEIQLWIGGEDENQAFDSLKTYIDHIKDEN